MVITSILSELADKVAIDWSQPLVTWSRDTKVDFLMLAWRLIGEAETMRDHGLDGILKTIEVDKEADENGPLDNTFVLTLRPLPGVDPIRSLRWVLKGLLRQHGMRCVDPYEEKVSRVNL
jgi:hypothetical protein